MTHTFSYNHNGKDLYFLWDVESGSLHNVDYAAYLMIRQKNNELSESEKVDFDNLDENFILDLEEELISLKEQGLLDCKEVDKYSYAKRKDIKALCLHICHDCNLACKYCFGDEGTYNTDRDYMSEEVGKSAIDFLIANSGNRKSLEVDFFGGEPLLNMDTVKSIVTYAREEAAKVGKEFSFTITTNAVNLNDENIKYINENMNNVVISIDGRKEVHNKVRCTRNGKDAYDTILNNAIKFRKVRGDKEYYIRGTFTGLNTDFYKDVLYLNDKGFDQISVEPVVLPQSHSLAIRPEQIDEIKESYLKLAKEYINRRKDIKTWFNFFHFMIDLEHGPCITKRLTGCGAGCEYLAISPLGDIYPCHQFVGEDKFKMGSVLDKSFSFNRDIQCDFLKVNVLAKEKCQNCIAKYFCSGGCTANAYHYENDIMKPYEGACEVMQERFKLALAIYAIENYGL